MSLDYPICRRCNGTGSIEEQRSYHIYEWPPIKCGVCNPHGVLRDPVPLSDIYECPDCKVIQIEDDDNFEEKVE